MQQHYGASGYVGVNERGNVGEASAEHPIYRPSPMDIYDPPGTRLWMVVCNEGWRESIVCTHMYEWAAEWLVGKIQGEPYAPGKH